MDELNIIFPDIQITDDALEQKSIGEELINLYSDIWTGEFKDSVTKELADSILGRDIEPMDMIGRYAYDFHRYGVSVSEWCYFDFPSKTSLQKDTYI